LLDFDASSKLCGYCSMCDAWICIDDQPKWSRRLKAASKRILESNFHGQSDYVEKMEQQLKSQEKNNELRNTSTNTGTNA